MTEKRKEFLKALTNPYVLTEEERIARGLSGDYLNNLEDRGNVFENARVQSETIKRKRIENKEDMR